MSPSLSLQASLTSRSRSRSPHRSHHSASVLAPRAARTLERRNLLWTRGGTIVARRELLLLAPLPLTVAPARSGYEDDGNMKFQDKIFLVRDLYLHGQNGDPAVSADSGFTVHQPWLGCCTNPPIRFAAVQPYDCQGRQIGFEQTRWQGPSGQAFEAGGLAPGSYLRRPGYREKSYSGRPWTAAVQDTATWQQFLC